ncbi:MAG: ferritin-like domain-containing protein [Ruminococcaceae bacterium]|nr:ferritin-like domain-containing protein [Oscillospiraceae bacterium]
MTLTQKESSLIKDLKSQEKLCIDKYTKGANEACDGQLKSLFTQLSQTEQRHFDTLTQIENGTVPQMNAGSEPQPQFTATYGTAQTPQKQTDCFLCSDALAMEKHASSMYDVSIFEFAQPQLRDVLNHIQKEEQGHGEKIYSYMSCNNMYS